jgi:hypothetical protein
MHPTDAVKETWRIQASDNVDSHAVLSTLDSLAVESTTNAMIRELVEFEAVKAL